MKVLDFGAAKLRLQSDLTKTGSTVGTVKVAAGDYLIAIDGEPDKHGDEFWRLLNYRLNRKVDVTLNSKPVEEGAWTTRIAGQPGRAESAAV